MPLEESELIVLKKVLLSNIQFKYILTLTLSSSDCREDFNLYLS